MVFVRALSEEERRALRQGVRREVGRVSERMRAVLLSARGYSVPQIAGIFECDEAPCGSGSPTSRPAASPRCATAAGTIRTIDEIRESPRGSTTWAPLPLALERRVHRVVEEA
jgi:hypothetical protein